VDLSINRFMKITGVSYTHVVYQPLGHQIEAEQGLYLYRRDTSLGEDNGTETKICVKWS